MYLSKARFSEKLIDIIQRERPDVDLTDPDVRAKVGREVIFTDSMLRYIDAEYREHFIGAFIGEFISREYRHETFYEFQIDLSRLLQQNGQFINQLYEQELRQLYSRYSVVKNRENNHSDEIYTPNLIDEVENDTENVQSEHGEIEQEGTKQDKIDKVSNAGKNKTSNNDRVDSTNKRNENTTVKDTGTNTKTATGTVENVEKGTTTNSKTGTDTTKNTGTTTDVGNDNTLNVVDGEVISDTDNKHSTTTTTDGSNKDIHDMTTTDNGGSKAKTATNTKTTATQSGGQTTNEGEHKVEHTLGDVKDVSKTGNYTTPQQKIATLSDDYLSSAVLNENTKGGSKNVDAYSPKTTKVSYDNLKTDTTTSGQAESNYTDTTNNNTSKTTGSITKNYDETGTSKGTDSSYNTTTDNTRTITDTDKKNVRTDNTQSSTEYDTTDTGTVDSTNTRTDNTQDVLEHNTTQDTNVYGGSTDVQNSSGETINEQLVSATDNTTSDGSSKDITRYKDRETKNKGKTKNISTQKGNSERATKGGVDGEVISYEIARELLQNADPLNAPVWRIFDPLFTSVYGGFYF